MGDGDGVLGALGRMLGVGGDGEPRRGRGKAGGGRAGGGPGGGARARRRLRGRDDPEVRDGDEDEPFRAEEQGDLDAICQRLSGELDVRVHHRTDEAPGDADKDRGPIELAVARRSLPVVREVLMQYPPTVRGRMLTDLHLYGRFRIHGTPFLGAAIPKARRINLPIRERTKAFELRGTLHHEIAHLVEQHPDFPVKAWLALNRAPYSGKGHREAKNKASRQDLREKGFVTAYANKNRHEDFAELAEVGFTKPKRMLGFAEDHEAIAEKVALMTEIYEQILPGLELPWTRSGAEDDGGPPRPGRGRAGGRRGRGRPRRGR